MTDHTKTESIKFIGTAGKVIADNVVDTGKGAHFSNGTVAFFGSDKGTDMFLGSKHDDIMLTRGAEFNPILQDSESVLGKGGYDTVVLPGIREDYEASIPDTSHYPSLRSPDWKDTDTLYGRIIILENVETEEKYVLNGVESIVFDKGNSFANPKVAAMELGNRVKDGSVDSVPMATLFKQAESALDPEDVHELKVHASREMSQLVSEQFKFGMDIELLDDIASGIVEKLDNEGIDVDERPMWKADDPTAEVTSQTYDLGLGQGAPKL